MTIPKVLLCLPRLSRPEFEHCQAVFEHAGGNDRVRVAIDPIVSSLLANGFNHSWCRFVNDASFTHWALLHADVAPSSGWLEALVAELDHASGPFGVMHAPCAIKDDKGQTSTGITTLEDYAEVRKITTTELQQLPETFGVEDVMNQFKLSEDRWCIAPNTGCMIVQRNRFPVDRFPGFHILDRLVRYPDSDGKVYAQVVSEDWNFGRWCARNGVSVGATRVKTVHYGRMGCPNDMAWGEWETDRNYADVARLKLPKPEVVR